jgi:hypothetical protein
MQRLEEDRLDAEEIVTATGLGLSVGGRRASALPRSVLRSIGQRSLSAATEPMSDPKDGEVVADPILGGLQHVYHLAA